MNSLFANAKKINTASNPIKTNGMAVSAAIRNFSVLVRFTLRLDSFIILEMKQ
jgi:hypothetical protein